VHSRARPGAPRAAVRPRARCCADVLCTARSRSLLVPRCEQPALGLHRRPGGRCAAGRARYCTPAGARAVSTHTDGSRRATAPAPDPRVHHPRGVRAAVSLTRAADSARPRNRAAAHRRPRRTGPGSVLRPHTSLTPTRTACPTGAGRLCPRDARVGLAGAAPMSLLYGSCGAPVRSRAATPEGRTTTGSGPPSDSLPDVLRPGRPSGGGR
jgi:hypothetical protein